MKQCGISKASVYRFLCDENYHRLLQGGLFSISANIVNHTYAAYSLAMKAAFFEIRIFTSTLAQYLNDEEYRELQPG
jgi:hypothetical protein